MSTLTRASNQWATRPKDERFASLEDLHASAVASRERARKASIATQDLHASVIDQSVVLNGKSGLTAPLTHWAFGQLARIANAPADYLRKLTPALAASCVNEGIAKPGDQNHDPNTLVLFDQNGSTQVRALTSTSYARIFDVDITSRLMRLAEQKPEWQPAPAAFDGSRGLYRGDRDMFAFLVDNDRRIFEKKNGGLSRGFFVWNSEVGAEAFGIMTFLYEYVCGNHMIWGAQAVKELRLRHVGNVGEKADAAFDATIIQYAESSFQREEELITRAQSYKIADTKDDLLDKVFGLRIPVLSRKVIESAYALADQFSEWYGDPRTAWGMANGITQFSQSKSYANQRVDLDRAAGKVLDLAF